MKSREEGFFYGHPQNHFWKVTASVFGEDVLKTIDEKKSFLLKNHIALWDVIGSCEIDGSSDSSIRNVSVNDIKMILETAGIQAIYLNGIKTFQLYQKHILPVTGREGICLPSTSPANAAWQMDKLVREWSVIAGAWDS